MTLKVTTIETFLIAILRNITHITYNVFTGKYEMVYTWHIIATVVVKLEDSARSRTVEHVSERCKIQI